MGHAKKRLVALKWIKAVESRAHPPAEVFLNMEQKATQFITNPAIPTFHVQPPKWFHKWGTAKFCKSFKKQLRAISVGTKNRRTVEFQSKFKRTARKDRRSGESKERKAEKWGRQRRKNHYDKKQLMFKKRPQTFSTKRINQLVALLFGLWLHSIFFTKSVRKP